MSLRQSDPISAPHRNKAAMKRGTDLHPSRRTKMAGSVSEPRAITRLRGLRFFGILSPQLCRGGGSTMWIDRQDLLYTIRSARRAPLLSAIAIVALSLGIGLNAGVFALLNNLFLGRRRGRIQRRSSRSFHGMKAGSRERAVFFVHYGRLRSDSQANPRSGGRRCGPTDDPCPRARPKTHRDRTDDLQLLSCIRNRSPAAGPFSGTEGMRSRHSQSTGGDQRTSLENRVRR